MIGVLLGSYRVVARLGEGGMGVVYIAHHETLGDRVAVKVLLPALSRDRAMVRRFFNEALALTAIRQPGIAQVFDVGRTSGGQLYFVMELLEGQSLTDRLDGRRLDYVTCCRIGRQVANVLQSAHEVGITHRDLRPDNLFLVPDHGVPGGERVKVLEFGIAKLTGEGPAGITACAGGGSRLPSYLSPEQCRSTRMADARSDIYALGCILFEMACGRPPFVGASLMALVDAHLTAPPPDPHGLAPDMPPKLSELIAKMLSKHPDARPQTMSSVRHALHEILHSLARDRVPASPPRSAHAHAPPVVPMPAAGGSRVATTLGAASGVVTVPARPAAYPRWYGLGAIVGVCVILAIGLVIAGDQEATEGVSAAAVQLPAPPAPPVSASPASVVFAPQPVGAAAAGVAAEQVFVLSCNLSDLAEARQLWNVMSTASRERTLEACLRNRITRWMLDHR